MVQKRHNLWSLPEAEELFRGWDAGESFTGIAIRLCLKFQCQYSRNMVAAQCRDHGLRRPKGFRQMPADTRELARLWRKFPPRNAPRRTREEIQADEKRRARLRDERAARIEEMCILRENGKSYEEIGKMYGYDAKTVRWHCISNNAAAPGESFAPERATRAAGLDGKIVALREMGLRTTQIAREVGLARSTVLYRLAVCAARDEAEGWG